MPASVQEAVERGTPMSVIRHVTHEEPLVQAIEFEIIVAMGRLNLNAALTLKPGQASQIAKVIYDTFKTESLGDLKLAFTRGSAGLYGEIFRLDGAVLVRWIQCYLDEKYQEVERIHAKFKQAQREEDDKIDPKEFYKRVNEWADRQREIEDEKNKIKREDRRKEALFRMQQIGWQRETFICDGIKVQAASEKYARMAYREMFKKEPATVEVCNDCGIEFKKE